VLFVEVSFQVRAAIPKAAEIEVEVAYKKRRKYSLLLGNRISTQLSVRMKISLLPVSILCPYA
jgi:hypothetical protein